MRLRFFPTAATVASTFLAPAMDARAHNLDQYDPSAAVDSQLERIQALALRLPPSREREGILFEVERAIDSNVEEAYAELAMCGDADQLSADLRRTETSGGEILGAKAIARYLRPALTTLLDPEGRLVAEVTDAHGLLRAAVNDIPRLMLLSEAVRHELGERKFELLRVLSETKRGASGLETPGAADEQVSARHGQR